MSNQLSVIQQDIYGTREQFMAAAILPNMNFEREAGFAIQLLTASDYAIRIATENRQSVVNAVTNIAAIGISLNPAKKQAYLVPRDGKICLDISYMGLLDIAIASGSIRWGQAELVYSADKFLMNGFDRPPTHERDPFGKDRGLLVGVYVVVKTCDGDYLTTTMTIDEVYAIRDRSSAWKSWIAKKTKCPWVTDEGEMVKKTVIKRAYKMWPKTDRLDTAVHYLNTDGGEGIELHDAPKSTSVYVDPGADSMSSLTMEQQNYIREVADDVLEAFQSSSGGPEAAFERIEIEDLDPDRKVALWRLLPSNVRSALKKVGASRTPATTKPATTPEGAA